MCFASILYYTDEDAAKRRRPRGKIVLGGNSRVTKLGNVHVPRTRRWRLGVRNGMRDPGSRVQEKYCQRGCLRVFFVLFACVLIDAAQTAFQDVDNHMDRSQSPNPEA